MSLCLTVRGSERGFIAFPLSSNWREPSPPASGRFLGQSYAIRRPIQTIQSQIDVRKKYRGVVY